MNLVHTKGVPSLHDQTLVYDQPIEPGLPRANKTAYSLNVYLPDNNNKYNASYCGALSLYFLPLGLTLPHARVCPTGTAL